MGLYMLRNDLDKRQLLPCIPSPSPHRPRGTLSLGSQSIGVPTAQNPSRLFVWRLGEVSGEGAWGTVSDPYCNAPHPQVVLCRMGNPGPWLQAELPLCRGSPGHCQEMGPTFPTDISRSFRRPEPGVGFILLGVPAMESGCWASSQRHLEPFLLYLSVCLPGCVCASA